MDHSNMDHSSPPSSNPCTDMLSDIDYLVHMIPTSSSSNRYES